MLPEKLNWRKLLRQLSPVLIASIGLHGLALLIPIPEKAPPEELEIELPEPISVTKLPKSPKPASPPEPSFAPAPVFVPPLELAPVVQPPQVIIVEKEPAVPVPTELAEPVKPITPEDLQPIDPPPLEIPPLESTTVEPQQYVSKETTAGDYKEAVASFFAAHGRDGDIETVLDLGYPANGLCFENETDLEAIAAVVFDKFGDIINSGLLRSSGYAAIDAWLTAYISPDSLSPLPDDVFSDLQQINANAPSDGDIRDWANAARDTAKQLIPEGQDKATYYFQIAITVEDSQCDQP